MTPDLESTWFKRRHQDWLDRQGLVWEPTAAAPAMTLAELRRLLLEVFSWGCVHQAAAQQRMEALLDAEVHDDRNAHARGVGGGVARDHFPRPA